MRTPWLVLSFAVLCSTTVSASAAANPLVRPAPDGRLVYQADGRGNAIPDFSRAGYGGGGVALPDVPVVRTLAPQPSGDDGARIQAALDEVGALTADARGFRGAVLLKRGVYRVGGQLRVRASGVVLRGEGQGPDDTVILATGKEKRILIYVGATGVRREEIAGTRRAVTDAYVPWSAKSLSLESVDGLSAGDRIVVFRPSTDAWIRELGMDRIKNRPNTPPGTTTMWKAGGYDLHIERTVVAIEGRRLALDAPLMIALEDKYGGGVVYTYRHARNRENGVENLRLVSEYVRGRETEDEDHAETGIHLDHVENAWVRDVTVQHFSGGILARYDSIFTTIQDCTYLDPVSVITGARRYSYVLDGQYGLVQRCTATEARHGFMTGGRVRGPNVFLDGDSLKSHSDSGPHHRWAVGVLYDNIADSKELNVQDRQWAGSGHGWAGGQNVFWNCTSPSIVVQQPPTAQNYAIGCIGELKAGQWNQEAARGLIASHGHPVTPRSLYLTQLEERLGSSAVRAIGK
jgi:hypothetical protein